MLLSNWFVRLVLNNPAFLWNALGVPLAQRRAFLVGIFIGVDGLKKLISVDRMKEVATNSQGTL